MSSANEIIAADDRRLAAMRANDPAQFEAVLSERLVYIHASGKVDSRASYVDGIRSGKTRFQDVRRSDENVTLVGADCAFLTGVQQARLTSGGEPMIVRLRFINVWAREDGGWRMIAWMAQSLPAATA